MNELRIPPHSLEAEQALLGSILLDPSKFEDVTVPPEALFDPRHSLLLDKMQDARIGNKLFDVITIRDYLKDKDCLDRVGGEKYLIELQDSIVVPDHINHYQEIVEENWQRRKVIELSSNAIDEAYKGEYDHASHIGKLFSIDDQKKGSREIDELGEEFIDDCVNGTVGHLPFFCQEWTDHLGKLDSDLIVLHAPRSTGKTAMMIQWINHIHLFGDVSPLCSIEMLKKPLSSRLFAILDKSTLTK